MKPLTLSNYGAPIKMLDGDANVAYGVEPFANWVAPKSSGVVAIIPARGGSRGIPHKATKKLGNKETIA